MMLAEVITQNEVLAKNKNIDLILSVDERLPKTLVGDQGRIKQIIINLVSNAIKFTDTGKVTVEATVHGMSDWRVIVTDTGIGMSASDQETIFDEFRQAEAGITRGGTGLGLSIVRKLVLMMGGNIRLNSTTGAGSTFTVTFPIKAIELVGEEEVSSTQSPLVLV
jgi:signal transduction histidine kinase